MILYLTYDGLSDPLGQSQILPYLEELATVDTPIHIISCEKTDRLEVQKKKLLQRMDRHAHLTWDHVIYHSHPKLISTYFDLKRLKAKAINYAKSHQVKIVHCRSYPTATIGASLKKSLGLKFIFDMRGLYIDERFDGGIWNKKNIFWKLLYPKLKKLEGHLINVADTVISLTNSGKKEILSWDYITQTEIVVTPCSADLVHFNRPYKKAAESIRLGYLGSIGTWYLLKDMLSFFKLLNKDYPLSEFHFITTESSGKITSVAKRMNISLDKIKIYPASRNELPDLLASIDLAIFFIKPSYSKKGSSPTKLGELLGMGIPVICNKNIGDIDDQSNANPDHILAIDLEKNEFEMALKEVPRLLELRKNKREEIRLTAQKYFSLDDGVRRYREIYNRLTKS